MSNIEDLLQFQEFANVYEELSRMDGKRKMSPTLDEEPDSKRLSLSPVPQDLDNVVLDITNEFLKIKEEPTEDGTIRVKTDLFEQTEIKSEVGEVMSAPPLKIMFPSLLSPEETELMPKFRPGRITGQMAFPPQGWMDGQQKVYSNNMSDCCTHRCQICQKTVTVTGMRNHSRTAHGLPINAYSARFGHYRESMERITWHRCGLCDKDILLDGDEIHKHCNAHRIMMAEYTAMFIVTNSTKNGRKMYDGRSHRNSVPKIPINYNSVKQEPVSLPQMPLAIPSKPGDVFGTIDEIEGILQRLPEKI